MHLAERYRVEALDAAGEVIDSSTGNLVGAAMVSFIPSDPSLPRHDMVGQKFTNRFGRGFIRALGGGMKEYVHCVVCSDIRFYVKTTNGTLLATPADYELYI